MAKGGKNEILLSIALEGDAEIKSKLKAVGEAGKQSLADIERQVGRAGENAGKRFADSAAAPLSKVQQAFAPLLEGSGLGGLLRGIGGAALGAGLPAALAGLGAQLAKIREETELVETRFKALGASAGAFDKLRESARKVGADPKDLASANEEFLSFKRRQELQSPYGLADASEEQFRAAQRALIAGGRIDGQTAAEASQKARGFLGSLYEQHDIGNGELAQGLTAGALQALGPNQGNLVARAIGRELGIPIRNREELDLLLSRRDREGRASAIRPDAVFRALPRVEPEAVKEADERRTFGERVGGGLGELQRTFGDILGPSSGKVGTESGQSISSGLDLITKGVAANKPTAEAFGRSGRDLGERTGIPGLGTAGEALGTAEGLTYGIVRDSAKGYGRMGSAIGDLFGSTTIGGFLSKAFGDPGALQEKPRPALPQQRSDLVEPQQQSANLSTAVQDALRGLVQGITAGANAVNPPDTKVREPVDSLGVRGALEDSTKDVAISVKDAGSKLAQAIEEIAANLKSSGRGSDSAPSAEVAAAGGGLVRWLDGGGHVMGPGTSTSDSIPAMLSDGEYVIRAEAARKIGRGPLDRLNSGHYAGGGFISRLLGKVRGFAKGGGVARLAGGGLAPEWFDPDLTPEESIQLLNETVLSPEQLRLVALNNAQTPEESIKLLNRFVMRRSGGGPVGHFADGGTVSFADSIGHLFTGGAAADKPSIADLGDSGLAASGAAGHVIDLRTNSGDFRAMTSDEVLRKMAQATRDSSIASGGTAPSWVYGR
ncbi:hypothetical protein [Bradyrhizobium stylosanthis]|uniref:hypothetical protein n=1 Tax=Bradyrhizobium stylosanthis TaxID=1803665 RepID=UPI0007C4651F|nr:hypothetical protein [Bradyrhizobium stylosanthis]